jgi:hypothetical protein
MGIPSISGVGRVGPSSADTPASTTAAAASRPGIVAPVATVDELMQPPVPPRFPWLSRLSLELESAAKRRPAFAPAPMLGDHVDKSA